MTTTIDQWRISDGWFDIAGRWNPVSDAVRDRLRHSIDQKLLSEDQNPALPVWFVRPGEVHELKSACAITLEDGTEVPFDELATTELHNGRLLPADLPLGSHRLVPLDGGPATHLFVVPTAQQIPSRCWGWMVQLYAARSRNSWGQGDLVDLANLADWSAAQGASLVSHNPLGDTLPIPAQEPSPYFTSSRKFASLLYLRIEAVPGAMKIGDRIGRLGDDGRSLNNTRMIDRDEIFRLKLSALREIWAATSDSTAVRTQLKQGRRDSELVDHATFNALSQQFGSGWSQWDPAYSHPRSRAVVEFRDQNKDKVDFWIWVQSQIAVQHRQAAQADAGLMNDLPVGFSVDGSDAWVDQDCLALDWRIGAPGDEFNPDGQNWGIVPYLPQKLRSVGYQPWIRTLRRLLQNTQALRVDHVMGLFRLFLIPETTEGNNGAYLYQFGTELLDIALMEAVRAGVTLAGEDLGTVEEGVREELQERNVLGYKVGWFEETAPSQWSPASIGSITTHDLPTVAGILSGSDMKQRVDAGFSVDPADDERMLDHLGSLVGDDVELSGTADAEIEQVIISAHRGLAESGSCAVFSSLDDACAVRQRPNLPGTVDENPNWRVALPVAIEDLDTTLAPAISDVMRSRAAESRTPRARR